MSFLPALAKLALNDMEHIVAGEIAKSKGSQNIETIRARQAHYIKWCDAKHLEDPVGPQSGFQVIVACYIKYVMTGVNYLNKESVRSATCRGYAVDAAKLFTLRGFPSPVDFQDETNWTRILVHNLEREEDIAKQRRPLNALILAEMHAMAQKAGPDSVEAVSCNVTSTGKELGWRSSEHSQAKEDEVSYHVYPSGKKVIKSMCGNNVKFSDKK